MENDIKFEDFVDIDDFINTNESSEDGPVGQDGNEYEKMTIMELMDEVVTFSKCHKLDEAFFFNESSLLSELSSRIHVSPFQAVLISILVEEGQRMSLQDFGRVLGYTRIRILREIGSFMDLSERHIFEPSSCAKRGYRLNEDALEAYCADQDYVYHIPTGIDNVQFFELAQKILVKIQSESSSHRYAVAWGEVEELLQANQQLTFASTMLTYDGLTDIQRITLIYMALRLCCNGRSALVDTTIERDLNMDFAGAYSIEEVILALRASKMVDYSFADGHAFDLRYSLTEKACQELFPGLKMEQKLDCQEVVIPQLVDSSKLELKELYFNEEDEEQILKIGDCLKEDKLKTIRSRLAKNGLRTGIACIFYGAPGTGKTETAFQLAKATGRNIMPINVSEIKDKWVGGSEKNIKRVFDDYREISEHQQVTPILLFNEADAIFGRRIENVDSAVEQMQNSIQNIILQELETFNGILIATTNLIGNLDDAFERRFLFKVKFNKPNEKTRNKIFKSAFPQLSDWEVESIAKKFRLTGGEIENIHRKILIENVLTGQVVGLSQIEKLCATECVMVQESRKVGFHI